MGTATHVDQLDRTKSYRWYVLSALTGLTTLNYLDRVLMGLLLQPMKVDLQLSDSQLGFLTGIAFAFFYATLGIPISRWADRGNRVTIASLAIGLWGLTVMACFLVTNFYQLLAARIAAAVGEAGCLPPTYSLVGDYFPKPGERARALAIYIAANPIAVMIGSIAGGWLNARFGWRVAFFSLGAPGLMIAAIVGLTVTEPRASGKSEQRMVHKKVRLTDVLRALWCQRSSRYLLAGYIFFMTLGWGLAPWYAAFMSRSHGMSPAEFGLWYGLFGGITGLIAMIAGGHIAGRWLVHDEACQLRLMAQLCVLLLPCFALFLLMPQKSQAWIAFIPLVIVFNCFSGPLYALMQRLVPDNMRATALAVALLLSNLIGMGLGPQIIGLLSDELSPYLGLEALRYAMLSMTLAAFGATYYFWKASITVKRDLEDLRRQDPDSQLLNAISV